MCIQVDEAKAANKPLDQVLELYDALIAAFNEAKGYVRHSISGGARALPLKFNIEAPGAFKLLHTLQDASQDAIVADHISKDVTHLAMPSKQQDQVCGQEAPTADTAGSLQYILLLRVNLLWPGARRARK